MERSHIEGGAFYADAKIMYAHPRAENVIQNVGSVVLLASHPADLERVTRFHGRSFIDPKSLVFFKDTEFNDGEHVYPALSVKGADISSPHTSDEATEPTGVRVNGLFDASLIERATAMSNALHAAGVLAERIIYAAIPQEYAVPGEDGFRAATLKEYKEYIYQATQDTEPVVSKGVARALTFTDESYRFGVIYRAGISNYRLADQSELGDEELSRVITESITRLQQHKPEHFAIWDEINELDPTSEEDLNKYTLGVLPQLMGENLAKAHNANISHGSPHLGNWTFAGELYDLDSASCGNIFEDDGDLTIAQVGMDITRVLEFMDKDQFTMFLSAYTSAREGVEVAGEEIFIGSLQKMDSADSIASEDLFSFITPGNPVFDELQHAADELILSSLSHHNEATQEGSRPPDIEKLFRSRFMKLIEPHITEHFINLNESLHEDDLSHIIGLLATLETAYFFLEACEKLMQEADNTSPE